MFLIENSKFGAWIPWSIVEQVAKLRLRPASRWQVFVLILTTSCRYGRKEARLSVKQIAATTGLGERTVKAALADLIAAGHVRRPKRYCSLEVPMLDTNSSSAPLAVGLDIPLAELSDDLGFNS